MKTTLEDLKQICADCGSGYIMTADCYSCGVTGIRIYLERKAPPAYANNPNCDGDKCTEARGEVRRLPLCGGGNLILCKTCYRNEMAFRRDRNRELGKADRFDLPAWKTLKVYP